MKARIPIPEDQISAFCQRWGVSELALFGSVLRDDFQDDSDVDILITFPSEAHHGLFDMVRMQTELASILGREVDLVERVAVERSQNYIRRRSILSQVGTLYAGR